jgi:hypothetical protein
MCGEDIVNIRVFVLIYKIKYNYHYSGYYSLSNIIITVLDIIYHLAFYLEPNR